MLQLISKLSISLNLSILVKSYFGALFMGFNKINGKTFNDTYSDDHTSKPH